MRRSKWDVLVTAALVICAVVTTGLVVRREFTSPPARAASPSAEPVFLQDWKSYRAQGVQFGSAIAPVQLIEFADFECPYCSLFHKTLKSVQDRYPDRIAVTYVHLPLDGHRFAEPAARAAECAGEQGRFEALHDLLYEEPNKLGLKTWAEFATEAGVADLAAFETCTRSTAPVPRIEAGKQLAAKLNIEGTPTLIVNGWKLGQPPNQQQLEAMVENILKGRSPVAKHTP